MSAPPLPEEKQARRRAAYEATSNDQAAALALGINAMAFKHWRRAQGLPSRRPRGGKPKDIEIAVARLIRLYGIDAIRAALETMR